MTAETCSNGKRRLFQFSPTLGLVSAQLALTNERKVISDESTAFHLLDERVRGFGRHRMSGIQPEYLLKIKRGKRLNDVQIQSSFLVVTDAVKKLFESVDATAFDFLSIGVRMESGEPLSGYWLCDVTRVLDALDEHNSDISIIPARPKIYYLAGAGKLAFRADVIGDHHIFRMAFSERTIICDEAMYRACIDARITGLRSTKTETMSD